MKTLIILKSIHLGNTKKIAQTIANILHADIIEPEDFDTGKINTYDLIGFGSGIYSAKHHQSILDLAEELPNLRGKKGFIFSTAAMIDLKNHNTLKKILIPKNIELLDEFTCKGFNKNSFLKYFGGMNKGRPNALDFQNAEDFAKKMKIHQ